MLLPALLLFQLASDQPDLRIYERIRTEGAANSQVMTYAAELIDGIGPRLTGSPNLKRAVAWARQRLAGIGCVNVTAESWGEFGMGWQQRHVSARMLAPAPATFIVEAAPWSPSTKGAITADLVRVNGFQSESDFAAYRGKLAGKIILLGTAPSRPEIFPIEQPLFERLGDQQLSTFAAGSDSPAPDHERTFARFEFAERAGRFLASEKVAAVIVPSGNNAKGGASGGTMHVDGNYTFGWYAYQREHAVEVPLLIMAIEHYGRLLRMLERGTPVRIEVNVDTETTGDREPGENVFADIPGIDRRHKDELVIIAAHLDSWSAGTGATDDGAGVLIAMEAMRILNALRLEPRRTIRIALWTGEEQGSLGARAWVGKHIATVPLAATPGQPRMPDFLRRRAGPPEPKPMHALISAVYTLDAGGGKIRGVSVSGNAALIPIFEQWFAPLKDVGVTMIARRSDCGGDCAVFEQAGIPTPSFKQDPLDYDSRTHHTNMDTYEHLIPDDLRQAAIVLATMLYNTAMREELLPRSARR